ncbi:RsbS, negative regulator of sigma-B [Minicystis rosea]|nr:RsbS, negative regulator of sigma-B [Minicystis rosea]
MVRKLGTMLLVTVPGSLTDSQVGELKRLTISTVRRNASRSVVLDFSEVEICDSFFGRFVHSIAASTKLLGADVVVCGLSDAVVETLVEMGFELPNVRAVLDLDAAMELATPGAAARPPRHGAEPSDPSQRESTDEDDRTA